MSYAGFKGPILISRAIAGVIFGVLLWVMISVFGPQVYTSYKLYHIEACENEHGLLPADKKSAFGFDAGGWTVTVSDARTRAFADCVRDRLSVPVTQAGGDPHPVIGVSWNSARMHPTVSIFYNPGASFPSQK